MSSLTEQSIPATRPSQGGKPDVEGDGHGEQGNTLRVIAVFKLLKGIVLFTAGLGAFGLLRADWNDAVVDLLHQMALEHGRRLASAFLERGAAMIDSATPRRLTEVAIGCFVYGGVFLVEAVGLWTRKRWAEYLTTVMTASLLPFEIMALVHKATMERGLALLLNIAIVAYLVFHLWKSHRSAGPGATSGSTDRS